jgi:hypothetical protein
LCFELGGKVRLRAAYSNGAFTLTPLSPYDNPRRLRRSPLLRGSLSYFINKYRIAF